MTRLPRARLVCLAAVLTLTPACQGQDPGGDASDSWRITYRAEAPTIDTTTVDVIEVARPYRARQRTFNEDATELVSGTIWTETGLFRIDPTGAISQIQTIAPGRPGPDVRLDASIPEAVHQGLIDVGVESTVGEWPCLEYRTRGPLDATLPEPPGLDEFTISCLDDQGRVLRDEWHLDGQVIRRRVAQAVEEGVTLDDKVLFNETEVVPVPDGLQFAETQVLDSLPDPSGLAVAFPPSLDGLPLDLVVETRDVAPPVAGPQPVQLTWRATYTDANRLIVLEQARTLSGPSPPTPTGDAISLPPLQDAVLELSFDGLSVTGVLGDLRVTLRGTISRAALTDLALVPA